MITEIYLKGLIPGLNGTDGLIRENHWKAIKRRELYKVLIRSQTTNRHKGKVIIKYIGYKSILMDWDNFAASFKHIGDALVSNKIIKDDKPAVVVQFLPEQIKCKRIEQKVVIIIEDY